MNSSKRKAGGDDLNNQAGKTAKTCADLNDRIKNSKSQMTDLAVQQQEAITTYKAALVDLKKSLRAQANTLESLGNRNLGFALAKTAVEDSNATLPPDLDKTIQKYLPNSIQFIKDGLGAGGVQLANDIHTELLQIRKFKAKLDLAECITNFKDAVGATNVSPHILNALTTYLRVLIGSFDGDVSTDMDAVCNALEDDSEEDLNASPCYHDWDTTI